MNQLPKIKPHFGFSKEIDSSHSLRIFYIKQYKHVSKLKITKTSKNKANANRNQKYHKFIKLSPSLKGLKHLDLSQYNLENYTSSQINLIVKKFHRISQFSRLTKDAWTKDIFLTKRMLKKAKNLSHLSLSANFDGSSPQFFRLLSRSKLESLHLAPMASVTFGEASLLDFSKYSPQSLQELSLMWPDETFLLTERKYSFSLNHLRNLQKLALAMPLPVDIFKRIVQSIAEPSKIKSLRFSLIKEEKEENCEPEIAKFLSCCLNLEELIFKAESDIYQENNLAMKKLKTLSIEQAVESVEELLRIGSFTKQQKDSLESLTLASDLWHVSMKVWFIEFLGEMKELKRLKKLNLNLKLYLDPVNMNVKSLFGSLTELIEALEYLEEIDFLSLPADFKEENDFGNFCKALEKRRDSLKSLRISLNGLTLDKKNSEIFIESLKSLKKLEYLALHNIRIEDSNFYIALKEIICCQNRNLNSVILMGIRRREKTEDSENMIKMLKGIIGKRAMKNFCYVEDWKGYSSSSGVSETLKLPDILKEVYHFHFLKIPSETCQPPFNLWNLDSQKWGA